MGNFTHENIARNMARENPAICSHRFKTESGEKMAFCDDCRTPLFRKKQIFQRIKKDK